MREEDFVQFYVVRTSKSHYYLSGSGSGSAPQLYTSKGRAQALANRHNNRYGTHKSDGPYEAVPVRLVVGETEPMDVQR